ncbi:long tail fiber proximal subunit [Aeromonas phage Aswh_1]|nr:long tail fiber proximal subunit [Aeromonas phage Aswh_1]
MADNRIPLRVTDGLDAAGKQLVNVGYPDFTDPLDGMNVQAFIDKNTIQLYDPNRKYEKDFAAIYNNRIYICLVDITTPEAFTQSKWKPVRTDPSWRMVTSNAPAQTNLLAGEHVVVQSSGQDIGFTMPTSALQGDMIVIRDNGTNLHDNTIDVSGNGRTIGGEPIYKITAPYSTVYFILNGNDWIPQIEYRGDVRKKIISNRSYPSGGYYKAFVGDQLVRETQYIGGINITLPRYAKHGDTISTYDLDGNNPVTKTYVSVHSNSTHNIIVSVGSTPVKTAMFDSTDWGMFVFDANQNAWRVFDSDSKSRWKSVKTATYKGEPNDQLVIYTETPSTVTVTFPRDAAQGDSFFVDTRYMVQGSTLVLNVDGTSTNDYFMPDGDTLTNPRISAYRALLSDLNTHLTKTQSFNIQNRGEQWEFVFFKNALGSGKDVWAVVTMSEIPYRVDRNVRDFYGMAAIASQDSVNKNKEDIVTGQNPDCEDFVTSETLANKTATGTRRGIARLSTNSESKATTGNLNDEAWSGVIITPFLLNDRLATTSMRGLLKVATQAQANAQSGTGENWAQIAITPQTLNGRVATETMTGLSALVAFGGTKQTTRTTAGTGVHDFNDHIKVITPKTLFEKVATENSQGMVFLATQGEANTGAANTTNGALVVTASTLEGRQATATLTGLSRAANSTEVLSNTPPTEDNVHVSIKGLVNRQATETRWGLAETATQLEVDAGILHDKWFVTPKTFGNWLSRDRITVSSDSGLTSQGNIWDGQLINIQVPTEIQRGSLRVATQIEANDMSGASLDNVAITPKKLSARQASTTQTGILYIATQSDVDTGTNNTKAVTPLTMTTGIRSGTGYRMTDTRYGVGITAILTNSSAANSVFEGNDILGSTRTLSSYAHGDVLVSPRGLNTALANYLPLKAVAVSASAMEVAGNRIPSTDWVRRTVAQTITGAMTFSQDVTISKGTCKLILNDSGSSTHNTIISFTNSTDNSGWDAGVGGGLNSPFTLKRIGSSVIAAQFYDTATSFSGRVSNGGQDPSGNNELVRFGYSELRYVRSEGSIAETISGNKTFIHDTYFKRNGIQNLWMGNTSKSGITIALNESLTIGSLGGLTIRPNGVASPANTSSFESNGNLKVYGQVKIGSSLPMDPDDAIRKDYLDAVIDDVNTTSGSRVFKGGDTMTGELIINSGKAITTNGDANFNGTTTVNKLRIAVGNGEFLEIRANPVTKSVDFVWIS